MQLFKDDVGLTVFINGVGVWVPRVHDDGLNGFSPLVRQLIKESLQSSDHSVFINANDVAGRVLQHHGQVA